MFVPRALQHPGWLERYGFCLVGLSDSVPKLDEARWWASSRIFLCFSIVSTSTGAASFISSSGLLPRPRDCHPRALDLCRFRFGSPSESLSSRFDLLLFFFRGGEEALSNSVFISCRFELLLSYDRHRPRQNGVFACLWNDAQIQILHRPR